jgi:phospholipase A1
MATSVYAAKKTDYEKEMQSCLNRQLQLAPEEATLKEIRATCKAFVNIDNKENVIARRISLEREGEWNPFLITGHKQNYILPLTYADGLNEAAFDEVTGEDDVVQHWEAKFQLSLKIPLNYDKLFVENDGLYFGFTVQSYWQVYNSEESSPFRETNYNPEFFYTMPLNWHLLGGDTGLTLGAEHQSNGRSEPLSRSWNRIYSKFLWADEDMAMSLKAWYRVPEDNNSDDNPDIDKYMGYFEYEAAYEWDRYVFSGMLRRNFRSGKGALEVGVSFPLYGRLKGYVQYFDGYGESLIDYDYRVQRLGIGLLLTDFL